MNILGLFLYYIYNYTNINMNMYYKTIKSNLTFSDAINHFRNGYVIRLENDVIDPNNVNIMDLKFSYDQITSNNWEVVDTDYDMIDKLDEVRDMMQDINLDIDSRFYDELNMDISGYWDLFENQFVIGDEDLQYEFMKYYINCYKK